MSISHVCRSTTSRAVTHRYANIHDCPFCTQHESLPPHVGHTTPIDIPSDDAKREENKVIPFFYSPSSPRCELKNIFRKFISLPSYNVQFVASSNRHTDARMERHITRFVCYQWELDFIIMASRETEKEEEVNGEWAIVIRLWLYVQRKDIELPATVGKASPAVWGKGEHEHEQEGGRWEAMRMEREMS